MGTATAAEPIKPTCDTLRAEGEKINKNTFADTKAQIESGLPRLKMNDQSFLGVFGEDPTACYAGVVQKIHTEANTDKTQVILFAITIIKSKAVFDYRTSVFNPNTVTNLFAKLKLDVAALYAANK
jgi:hypothetical protein